MFRSFALLISALKMLVCSVRYESCRNAKNNGVHNVSNPYVGEGGMWFLSNLRQRACAVAVQGELSCSPPPQLRHA